MSVEKILNNAVAPVTSSLVNAALSSFRPAETKEEAKRRKNCERCRQYRLRKKNQRDRAEQDGNVKVIRRMNAANDAALNPEASFVGVNPELTRPMGRHEAEAVNALRRQLA